MNACTHNIVRKQCVSHPFFLFFATSQTAHGGVISRRQSVERMTDMQQSKYHDLQAGLPSELSMQLAEVTLALGSAEDQVSISTG